MPRSRSNRRSRSGGAGRRRRSRSREARDERPAKRRSRSPRGRGGDRGASRDRGGGKAAARQPRGSRSKSRQKSSGEGHCRSLAAKRSRSRKRSRPKRTSRQKSPGEGHCRSPVAKRSRSRKRSRPKRTSRSKSRPKRARSKSVERVPPVDFADYEPETGGWYVYRRTGKWKYHPETGVYLHVKSKVYYVPKDGDSKTFRKVDGDEEPVLKKMKQFEEMRKAIEVTEFVKFEEVTAKAKQDNGGSGGGPPIAGSSVDLGSDQGEPPEISIEPPPAPKIREPEPKILLCEGRVQKWDADKGFGFIVALNVIPKEGEELSKGVFVHRKNVVGSTPANPINLKAGGRIFYIPGVGEQDGRPCALEVVMVDDEGKPLPIHAGAQTLEEKKKSYYVSAESLGLRVHAESWPGLKKTLQDRYVADEPMEELGVFFAVLDGHGGTQVADHAAKTLHRYIMTQFRQNKVQPASRDEKIKHAIREAFLQTDKDVMGLAERKQFQLVGSTCVTALLHGNPKLGIALRLVVANLGDSRAVLCRGGQAVAVSEDHTPARSDEKKRIERAGGLVLQVRGHLRVAASTNPNSMHKSSRREYQGLAMTRSFGDLYFKQPAALSVAEPEIQVVPLSDKDLFLVLATDGVYDVMSNQEVVDLALRHWGDPEEAAKNVVRSAYGKGSEDNLTVLIVQFGWADKNATRFLDIRRRADAGAAGLGASAIAAEAAARAARVEAANTSRRPVDSEVDMFG